MKRGAFVITVKNYDMIEEVKGFTIYNGDYNIIINSHLSATERTEVYQNELANINNGKYKAKLSQYKQKEVV